MRLIRPNAAFFALSACLMMLAFAVPAKAADTFTMEEWEPAYLQMIKIGPAILDTDFETQVSEPPTNDSIATEAELQTLILLKAMRDEDAIKKIFAEKNTPSILDLYIDAGFIKEEENANTVAFFNHVDQDIKYFILRDKLKFSRVRPSTLEPTIEPVFDNPRHAAYPSGHASESFFIAFALAEMNPQKAEEYEMFARGIAQRREIADVHYSSDTQAGKVLAKNVLNALLENDDVMKRFEAAKEEYYNEEIS